MASLANQTISSTYDGLIKTSTDQPVGVSGVQLLEDGVGNTLALSVGRANQGVTVTGTLTATSLSGTIAAASVLADGVTATTQSSGDNSTKVATTAYVDAQVTASDLDFAGDSGTGAVDLDSQSLTIAGTANEIETSASGQTITIGLPSSVTVGTLTATTLAGTLSTAAQTNITSVGTLTSLTVAGALNGTLSTAAQPNITSVGRLINPEASGTFRIIQDGTDLFATIQGPSNRDLRIDLDGNDDSDSLIVRDLRDGSERFKVESGGNVGIGTSSPSKMLDLSSNNNAGTALNVLRFTDTDTTCLNDQPQGAIEFYTSDTTDAGVASAIKGLTGSSGASLGRLVFETAGTEKMRIDSSGNVGIGSSSPVSKLTLEGARNTNTITLRTTDNDSGWTIGDEFGAIEFYSNDTSGGSVGVMSAISCFTGTTSGSTSELSFSTSEFGSRNVERMRIDSSGNVGIGTNSPDTKLTIASGLKIFDSALTDSISISASTSSSYVNTITHGDVGLQFNNNTLTRGYTFSTNSVEKVRINQYGLTFNGDTAAANALDDYEEGTFTPEVADATTGGNVASVGAEEGAYTKIGNQVLVSLSIANIDTSGLTSGNSLVIRNLPFVAGFAAGAFRGSVILDRFTFSGYVTAQTEGATIKLKETKSTDVDTNLTVAAVDGTGSDILLTITYTV